MEIIWATITLLARFSDKVSFCKDVIMKKENVTILNFDQPQTGGGGGVVVVVVVVEGGSGT